MDDESKRELEQNLEEQETLEQIPTPPTTPEQLPIDEQETLEQIPIAPATPKLIPIDEQETLEQPAATLLDQGFIPVALPEKEMPEQERSIESATSREAIAAKETQVTPIPPASPVPRKKRKQWGFLRIALVLFAVFLVLGGSILGIGYYYYYNTIHQPVSKFIRPVTRSTNEPKANDTPAYDVIKGRSWNILLLGSDNDQKYNFPAVLTQVMMIVHIDTVKNSVYMVSIPRDSWVYVPENGAMHKIDQAFFLGAIQRNNFEDGVRLARLTVEKAYGISIDRYGWVGLSGFAKVIDTLGGVDIDVAHPVVDEYYPDDTGENAKGNDIYALKRLYMSPGPQHLNGLEALEYVRSRHADLVGDIGRTHRQQQVLEALKLKLNITTVLERLPELIKDLTGSVYTDLNEQEMLAFANYGRALDNHSIQRITFSPGDGDQNFGDYASIYDPSVGAYQDVIIPNCATIEPVINNIFELGNAHSCQVTGS